MDMRGDRIMKLPEVLHVTGLSRSELYRLMAAGLFPQRRELGPRAVGWRASEVDHWVDARPTVGEGVGE